MPQHYSTPHQDGWQLVAAVQEPRLDLLPGGKARGRQAGRQLLDQAGVQRDADKLVAKLCRDGLDRGFRLSDS